MVYCKQCLEKQREIDELKEKVASLQAKLRYQERTAQEGFFGSSTPSAQIPVKPNRPAGPRSRGGGKAGHAGHGRSQIDPEQADRVEAVPGADVCPDCGGALEACGSRSRTVLDCQPVRVEKVVYRLPRQRCTQCHKLMTAKAPGVLPKGLYSNRLLTYVAVQHYVHGQTLGQIERQTGLGYSSLVDALHQLSARFQEVPKALLPAYRQAPVKHADETGWRTEGRNGYAWLFCTEDTSLYRFRGTRSGRIAREVFGHESLPGVLLVDRYQGYNRMPCSLQYCYAHLLRDVKDLDKAFAEDLEVHAFVEALVPQLASAISLRGLGLPRRQFLRQAAQIKSKILAIVNHPAHHPAVQTMQDLFREQAQRMYHWADDPQIPADNNRAERELRPLVIARKISFGSQSEAGAETRETLMTVLHTLRKRVPDVATAFQSALDQLAEQPDADPAKTLFGLDSS
jgi:transposase